MPLIRIGRMSSGLPGYSVSATAVQLWERNDQPYGAFLNGLVNSPFTTGHVVGKQSTPAGGGFIKRNRAGAYFPLPASLAGYTTCTITFSTLAGRNSLETFRPAVWLSASDQSAFILGWQDDLDTLAGYGVFDSSTGIAHPQSISFSAGLLTGTPGGNQSIVIGNEYELLTAGVGVSGSGKADFEIIGTIPGTIILTLA